MWVARRGREAAPKTRLRIRAVLETARLEVPRWLVDRVVLYESRLSSSGPSYHTMTSGLLGAPPV